MIKISCQSTGINAKRHVWLKSRLPYEEERGALINIRIAAWKVAQVNNIEFQTFHLNNSNI